MKDICSKKTVKAFERFNADLNGFRLETGDEYATLYEDAYTTREVKNFRLCLNGTLSWVEIEARGVPAKYYERMFDDDEARDFLSFWRACLRRAKRYWAMDVETLDAIQDPESGVEDEDEEE